MCLTSVSYTNRFYSCSECAAIEVDEWCQGNVSARLSERFHSWNVESQQQKKIKWITFLFDDIEDGEEVQANKWSTIWKSHETSSRYFHIHAVSSEHDSNLSFNSVAQFSREISSAWQYYSFITSDNKLTQLLNCIYCSRCVFLPFEALVRFFPILASKCKISNYSSLEATEKCLQGWQGWIKTWIEENYDGWDFCLDRMKVKMKMRFKFRKKIKEWNKRVDFWLKIKFLLIEALKFLSFNIYRETIRTFINMILTYLIRETYRKTKLSFNFKLLSTELKTCFSEGRKIINKIYENFEWQILHY